MLLFLRATPGAKSLHTSEIWYIARNPFYAGRPTSRVQRRGNKFIKREVPVATVGNYPAMETWEEHQELQEIAETLHISSGAVGVALHKARTKLESLLSETKTGG